MHTQTCSGRQQEQPAHIERCVLLQKQREFYRDGTTEGVARGGDWAQLCCVNEVGEPGGQFGNAREGRPLRSATSREGRNNVLEAGLHSALAGERNPWKLVFQKEVDGKWATAFTPMLPGSMVSVPNALVILLRRHEILVKIHRGSFDVAVFEKLSPAGQSVTVAVSSRDWCPGPYGGLLDRPLEECLQETIDELE